MVDPRQDGKLLADPSLSPEVGGDESGAKSATC